MNRGAWARSIRYAQKILAAAPTVRNWTFENAEAHLSNAWASGHAAGQRDERKKHDTPVKAVIMVDDGQDNPTEF